MPQFTIDPEFRDKIPPLTQEEFQKLEENILEDGEVLEPLVVWKNTIIDGHHRWKIIQKHPELNGKYKVKRMEFQDKWAAIVWMCRNQLGRRNITDEQKTALIGEAYKAQKMTQGNHAERGTDGKYLSRQNDDLGSGRTVNIVARDFGVGTKTVERAEHFVDGLDAAEKVSPGIKEAVLSGEVKAPKSMIAEIRNLPTEKAKEAADAIMKKDIPSAKETIKLTPEKKESEADRPAYDIEDFKNDLMAAVNTFDFSLRQHMVLAHIDILQTQEGKDAAEQALMRAKEIIKRYFIHIDSVVLRSEKNGKTN